MNSATRMLVFGGVGFLLLGLSIVLGIVYVGRGDLTAHRQPFQLVDTQGHAVTESVFQGRPTLLYFGYTNCPEVCPTTLIEMADWLNALGPDGERLQALFFTVDPARDTADVMGPYIASISNRITGVTGSEEEMRKATESWFVTAQQKGGGSAGSYNMRHTTSLLLVGPNGRLQGLIPYGTPREEAIDKIRQVLLRGPAPSAGSV